MWQSWDLKLGLSGAEVLQKVGIGAASNLCIDTDCICYTVLYPITSSGTM